MTMWQWFQPVSFQLMWVALIFGGNTWLPISIAILVIHFILSPSRINDIKILPLAFSGFLIDLCMMQTGFFSFEQWPVWLLILWVAFMLNLGHSLRFLRKFKLPYLVIFSAAGGVYAYWASWKFGAVDLPYGPLITLAMVGAIWAIFLPLCVKADALIRKPHHE